MTTRLATIDLLALPGVIAFSTQRGPDANNSDPYSGFNTCGYVGDNPAHVAECRRLLHDELPASRYCFPRQTHSLNVATVDETTHNADLENVDALVTNCRGVALCIHTADCVPVVIADPKAGVVAAVHSGWRGTVGRIVRNAVEAMKALGAQPSRMYAAMGPSICPRCFEVGAEVADVFTKAGLTQAIVRGYAKPHIDLGAAVAMTLRECGVNRISLPASCSRCNPLQFCSARYAGTASARTLTVIVRS